MKVLFTVLISSLGYLYSSASVIEDLISQISTLNDKESLSMTYNFVGCYGVYQKGTIEFTLEKDTIYYLSKSYDPDLKKSINQSGKYYRSDLVDLLFEAKETSSEEILGNAIHYQFDRAGKKVLDGNDKINQKHFIELFHPFSSFFQKGSLNKIQLSPKLKTPGINH